MIKKVNVVHAEYDESSRQLVIMAQDIDEHGNIDPHMRLTVEGEKEFFRKLIVPSDVFYVSRGDFNVEMHKTASMLIGKRVNVEIPANADDNDRVTMGFQLGDPEVSPID